MAVALADSLSITRARLTNWGKWAKEAHHLGYELSAVWLSEEAGATPDELDAARVERAMLEVRRIRWMAYCALTERYLRDRDDIPAADAQRMSVRQYRAWLDRGEKLVHRLIDASG